MSANNKTDMINKIKRASEFGFVIGTIILIFLALFLVSCQKQEPTKYSITVFEEKDVTDASDERAAVNITETNETSISLIIYGQPENLEALEIRENETINSTINNTVNEIVGEQGQEQITTRANAVEFYFLLKQKAYFRYLLRENELKSFDLSGAIIRIEPIFIANDSAVFKVDNYPTHAIGEREWYSAPNFEIYVSNIYYRR